MPRFKRNSRKQGLMLSLNLDEQLIPGSLIHTLDFIVEEKLDLSILEDEFNNDEAGACAYHPRDMLKIILYAFLNGILSTREIERLCNKHIQFIALSGDIHPDHTTIARFIHKFEPHISELFNSLLLYIDELGLISGTAITIDGCKITSNAAKEISGTFDELAKKKKHYEQIVQTILEQSTAQCTENEKVALKSRINKHQERIQKIDNFLNQNEKRIGARKREVKSNVTDNESAKLKSSHGVIQGYNALAAVDSKHQVVIATTAVGTQGEAPFLKEMVESSKYTLPNRITKETTVLADTGYFSEENCKYLDEIKQDAVIPDNHFRQRDPRFNRNMDGKNKNLRNKKRRGLYDHNDFEYLEEGNCYKCPTGKILRFDGKRYMHGHYGRRYKNKNNDCPTCHLKTECLRSHAKVRNLFIVDIPKEKTHSEKMIIIIDSEDGRKKYAMRMGIVEPVFANITYTKRMNRFNYRGKATVKVIWKLYCMVHNIEKVHKYGGFALA